MAATTPFKEFLYHYNFPEGKIFTDIKEYGDAQKNGWVEAPWLIEPEKPPDLSIRKRGRPPLGNIKNGE